jgi:Tol biopolymer transport system component
VKSDPAYSPDGSALAFVGAGESGNQPGIYIIRNENKTPVRLTSSATDIGPAWSPDGKRIAFLRPHPSQTAELMLVDVPGGKASEPVPTAKKLKDAFVPEFVARIPRPVLTWTPDGSAIVLPLHDPESGLVCIFRLGVDGTPAHKVVPCNDGHSQHSDSGPAFSGDGKWLAFSDAGTSTGQLYLVRIGPDGIAQGERQPVPGATGGIQSPLWSPDGKRLMWAESARLMEWDFVGAPRVINVASDRFEAMTAVWDANQSPRIVFANVGATLGLYAVNLMDEGRRTAGPPTPFMRMTSGAKNPALSPDGRWLAFVTPGYAGNYGELWIAGSGGENPHSVSTLIPGTPITWSPDSRHIAFHSRMSMLAYAYVVDIDETGHASQTRQLTRTTFDTLGPIFSSDGKYLYLDGTRSPSVNRIMRIPATGGELEDLFEGVSPRISTDGRQIIYGKSQTPGLFERSLEGDVPSNPETQIVADYSGPVGFLPTRNGLFYYSSNSAGRLGAIRFFDYGLRQSFDLIPPSLRPNTMVPVLSLSPDGSRLIYDAAAETKRDLTLIEFRHATGSDRY